MTMDAWIVVAGTPAVGTCIDVARSLGGRVTAVVVGTRALADTVAAGGVDRTLWLGEPGDRPVEAYAIAVSDVIMAAPGVVCGPGDPAGRVLLGAVAARLAAPTLTAIASVSVDGDELVATVSGFGGICEQTLAVRGPVVLVLNGGSVPVIGEGVPVEEVAAELLTITSTTEADPAHEEVDLGSASRVIGVGRGLKAEADLPLVQALADAVKGEVACSRPLAEGTNWLAKDRYVGVSGKHIAPALYIAVGISGQLQHMVGVRGATTIVAVNSDAAAPVFSEADYGLVGDLYELVPALTAALA